MAALGRARCKEDESNGCDHRGRRTRTAHTALFPYFEQLRQILREWCGTDVEILSVARDRTLTPQEQCVFLCALHDAWCANTVTKINPWDVGHNRRIDWDIDGVSFLGLRYLELLVRLRRQFSQWQKRTQDEFLRRTTACLLDVQEFLSRPEPKEASNENHRVEDADAVQNAPPPKNSGKGPNLTNWGIGVENGTVWWLFRKTNGRWQQCRKLTNLPKGIQSKVALYLAENGGQANNRELLKHCGYSGFNKSAEWSRHLKSPVSRLRKLIRTEIKDVGRFSEVTANPIPCDDIGLGAVIQMGIVVADDDGQMRFNVVDPATKDVVPAP